MNVQNVYIQPVSHQLCDLAGAVGAGAGGAGQA